MDPGGASGSPLQCSCLENPKDGGAWWAAVHGVAKSQTQLKRLSSSSSSSSSISSVQSLGRVQLFSTSWTVVCQTPQSMEFSRQEYWNVWPFLLQGIFPTQGLNLGLLYGRQILYCLCHQGRFFSVL